MYNYNIYQLESSTIEAQNMGDENKLNFFLPTDQKDDDHATYFRNIS